MSTRDGTLLPCPDQPGWQEWHVPGPFNRDILGRLLVRDAGDGTARTRIDPLPHMGNVAGYVHGGIISAFADVSLFAGPGILLGKDFAAATTIELSVQFVGAGSMDQPLEAIVSVLRETGRMIFIQGRIVQGDSPVAGFSGIVRKLSA
ncbi:PaaI family thioesterase [Altererythrobacter salegens]|uniref:PaaI family thioesterase n=1 Tax=Croceibacterium salegens TaxID=1737568 RepID=A0A6I4SXF3_9SPHN|nr:PaaI family thioesterase [Croceibacterium salegens]MXO59536.1 PaaI family thioesterase [Croceibacterium salegens]